MQRALVPRLLLGFAALCALAAAATAATGLDPAVFVAVNAGAARWLPQALPSALTILGHGLVAVMLLAPCLGRAPQVLTAALYAAPLAGLLSRCGKALVAAPRPAAVLDPSSFHVQGQLLSGHNSFPSGHSITIFLIASVLMLGLEPVRLRAGLALALLGLASSVAASRIMVGAHWPSDALGGAALGVLAGAVGTWAAGRWPLWRMRQAPIAFAVIVLGCAAALAVVDTGYPLAQPLQWAAAAFGASAAVLALVRALRAPRGAHRP
jgi:membrane-associated phospholipid phosphatase